MASGKSGGYRGILILSLLGMVFGPFVLLKGCQVLFSGDAVYSIGPGAASSRKADATSAPLSLAPAVMENRSFGEAPMLSELVRKGQLPPVSERLPENPLVVVPLNETGVYGGTIRRALTGDIVQVWGVSKTLSESLMGYERPLPNSIVHNLAESYEFQDGNTTVVFRIRKGVRWSDGVPFTVDDILFWYSDMVLDENARDTAFPPSIWIVDGEPMRFDKVDDYTLRIRSTKPLGRILENVCDDYIAYPKHVFSKLHPRYNPDASYEEFKERTTRAQILMTPGVPQISAWVPVEWAHGQRIVYDRNPYYWKVDSAGNQLPYADRVVFNVIQDKQVILLKFINGEIDLFGRYSGVEMFPTLKAEERKGTYKVHLSGPYEGPALYLNWDCPKPALRDAFRDKDVRVALSHAINRDEISQIVFSGMMETGGEAAPAPNSYFRGDGFRKYWSYDPEKVKAILDRAGYCDSDGDGWRELKDGSRFELTLDIAVASSTTDIGELIADHWRAVGVKVNLNAALRDIIWPRRQTGEFDVHMWGLEGCPDLLVRPSDWAVMGVNYPFWYKSARTEPQDWMRRASLLFEEAMTTVDREEQRAIVGRIRSIYTENVPMIAIGCVYSVWGSNLRLGNVAEDVSTADVFRGWSRAVFHEQVYIKSQ